MINTHVIKSIYVEMNKVLLRIAIIYQRLPKILKNGCLCFIVLSHLQLSFLNVKL